ncbi:hypothetical protein LXL04_031615 [Taraxacum kok-saghyz]
MSSTRRGGRAWMVAGTVGLVETLKDQGFARWNYTIWSWISPPKMKRGKDQDKTMGPMFPRLHVNDSEKGGPRAPPRTPFTNSLAYLHRGLMVEAECCPLTPIPLPTLFHHHLIHQ